MKNPILQNPISYNPTNQTNQKKKMQDNGLGFEIYSFPNGNFSIFPGTNRAKTLQEIIFNPIDWPTLQHELANIVTQDGYYTGITIMNMTPYNYPLVSEYTIQAIQDYCRSLGNRPTRHTEHRQERQLFDIKTGKIILPDVDTSLHVEVERTVVPKDPLSCLFRLVHGTQQLKRLRNSGQSNNQRD